VLANACGPCIGQWKRDDIAEGERQLDHQLLQPQLPRRNDGNPHTLSFIGSPEIVTALALAGTADFNPLTDSSRPTAGERFKLEPAAPAPELPKQGFVFGRAGYVPAARGARRDVDGGQGRPEAASAWQLLEPFAPWDGKDYEGCPCCSRPRASAPPTTSRPPASGCASAGTSTTSATTCSRRRQRLHRRARRGQERR
jgi:aconitate hydratase